MTNELSQKGIQNEERLLLILAFLLIFNDLKNRGKEGVVIFSSYREVRLASFLISDKLEDVNF
ncbi:hypothetical protein RV11_GL002975 [Enterococcus phoeniculicola]|jgi:hypothetical protein|nr:hypothetical protein RV11_GL002975 [Enterococcus phoeniculicola]